MLKALYIQNFVLIDSLDITFDKGLSVITGETGAGKSIILGALSLVLGARADSKSIKQGVDKCVIEATFNIALYNLEGFFIEHELEYDTENCILRRELHTSGKSRAFVNDSPVSLQLLKLLGSRLIDIHSQHQNLLLGDAQFQLKVTDLMAENEILLIHYKKEYLRYTSLKRELKSLQEQAAQASKEEDYVRFQLEQLLESKLALDEQELLEQELETLSHAEEIKGSLYRMTDILRGDEAGVVSGIKSSLSIADSLERFYPKIKEFSERLRSAYLDLDDLVSEIEHQQDDIEFNPERLSIVNERLNLLYTLQQKHRVNSVEQLIEVRDGFDTQLNRIDLFDEHIEAIQKELEATYSELMQQALVISAQRKQAAQTMSQRLVQMILPLGMPNTRFEVYISPREVLDADGIDEINFMFSANKSGELQPVAQTASGGEISRLMLCIKALIAGNTALPTIIFDEIDTGVSGDIADKMGDIMHDLGHKMQVLTITHLPQIAAKGGSHYFVYKQDEGERTVTQLRILTHDERVLELARMLSGAALTDAAMANARELLKE